MYVFSLQMLVCVVVASVASGINSSDSIRNAWYLTGALEGGGATAWFVSFFTNILLFQDILPISIYVSLDVVKTIQARMIQWDRAMYYAEADKAAVSKTSTLNEELGQIEYVFSDKTGTLTCNQMKFRCVSCFGRVFGKVALSSPQDPPLDTSLVPKNLHQHVNKCARAVCLLVFFDTCGQVQLLRHDCNQRRDLGRRPHGQAGRSVAAQAVCGCPRPVPQPGD